LNYIYIFKKKL